MTVDGANFGVFTGSGEWTPAPAIPNRWQHIAAVFTPTNVEFYANGARYSYGAAPLGQNTTRRLRIGASPAFGEYFQGFADEISVYNRALSAAEITNIYNAGLAGKHLLSALVLRASVQGSTVSLSFPAAIGGSYTVQSETSLSPSSWSVLSNLTAFDTNVTVAFPVTGSPQRFYRVMTTGN